jgi:hypothetical protein
MLLLVLTPWILFNICASSVLPVHSVMSGDAIPAAD